MQKSAYRYGIILLLLGPFTYLVSGTSSLSAFIPSIFGLILALCGYIANNEKLRPHAMHAALTVALIGILGIVPMLLTDGIDFIKGDAERPWAVFASAITSIALILFLIDGIKSFRSARNG
ncbi:MAG: hypothetical protein P8J51_04570 [Dehalococcoidia bacterium]|nr:hypothetical protein [Dehalococcoidia bacterium]